MTCTPCTPSTTSVYAVVDPRRFKLGTPDEVFRSIERAWTVAPSSKRIVEDILALPRVLSKIIEYEGCVVPGEVEISTFPSFRE